MKKHILAKVVSNTLEINLILEVRALNMRLTWLDFILVSSVKDYSKSTQDTNNLSVGNYYSPGEKYQEFAYIEISTYTWPYPLLAIQ